MSTDTAPTSSSKDSFHSNADRGQFLRFRNELRERDRSDARPSMGRLPRSSSHHDSGLSAGELDVRIITSSTKGKKFNRKNVIEQGTTPHVLSTLLYFSNTDAL